VASLLQTDPLLKTGLFKTKRPLLPKLVQLPLDRWASCASVTSTRRTSRGGSCIAITPAPVKGSLHHQAIPIGRCSRDSTWGLRRSTARRLWPALPPYRPPMPLSDTASLKAHVRGAASDRPHLNSTDPRPPARSPPGRRSAALREDRRAGPTTRAPTPATGARDSGRLPIEGLWYSNDRYSLLLGSRYLETLHIVLVSIFVFFVFLWVFSYRCL
jgi:hypothetical protein